jgi:hypothetical protein
LLKKGQKARRELSQTLLWPHYPQILPARPVDARWRYNISTVPTYIDSRLIGVGEQFRAVRDLESGMSEQGVKPPPSLDGGCLREKYAGLSDEPGGGRPIKIQCHEP